jgi:hypothetical protein
MAARYDLLQDLRLACVPGCLRTLLRQPARKLDIEVTTHGIQHGVVLCLYLTSSI